MKEISCNMNAAVLVLCFLSAIRYDCLAQAVPPNVRVNQDASGTGRNQNETTIAINPTNTNNLVAGSNYFTPGIDSRPAYYFTTDEGSSWTEGILPLGGAYDRGADPGVAFDASGTAWYVHISKDNVPLGSPHFARDNGLFVNRSMNGGLSWMSSPYVLARNGDGTGEVERTVLEDKPYIACDVLAGSQYQNSVYVAWVRGFKNASDQIYFSRRHPELAYFSSPVQISDEGDVQGPVPLVGPSGTVYVVWWKRDGTLRFDRSTNGGTSFGTDQTIVSGIVEVQNVKNRIRTNSFPSMAVDNSGGQYNGYAYVVWADKRDGNEPNIYMVVGTPTTNGGLNWSAPSRVNETATNDQWLPWVTASTTGMVHVVYYDSRNHPANNLADVYVATFAPGGASLFERQVNSASFVPAEGWLDRTFMGDYNGIAATAEKVYPFWTDSRSGTDQDVYIAQVGDFTLPVTVDQRTSGGTSVTTVGRWNGVSFNPRFAVPRQLSFILSVAEVLHGDTNIIQNEKFHKWNNEPDVRNHHRFDINGTLDRFTANLLLTYAGVAIRNVIIDAPSSECGNIQFRDPWYIDYNDPAYGNNRRNQGHPGALHTRSSPFNPGYDNPFPEGTYKGVFLTQSGPPNWNPPYYSVGAPEYQRLGAYDAKFAYWSSRSAAFSHPGSLETAVVFRAANDTVQARYKGYRISSNNRATAPNMQRKLLKRDTGSMDLVYESGGDIWLTSSTNDGVMWTPERLLSNFFKGTNRDPAITMGIFDDAARVVWHRQNAGFDSIYFWRATTGCQPVARIVPHPTIPPAPVVDLKYSVVGLRGSPSQRIHAFVGWTSSNGTAIAVSTYNGTSWSQWYSEWFWDGRYRPSFRAGQPWILWNRTVNVLHMSYDDGRKVFWRKRITDAPGPCDSRNPDQYNDIMTDEQIIPGSYGAFSGNSQIAADRCDPIVTWEIRDIAAIDAPPPVAEELGGDLLDNPAVRLIGYGYHAVCVARPEATSEIRKYVGSGFSSPTVTLMGSGHAALAWSDGTSLWTASSTDGGRTWSRSPTPRGPGVAPNLSIAPILQTTSRYVYTTGTSQPYQIALQSGIFPQGGDETEGKTHEVTFADHETGATLTIEMPPLRVKNISGVMQEIPFATSPDSVISSSNVESHLASREFIMPADAESLYVGIRVLSVNARGIAAPGGRVRIRVHFTPNYGTARYTAATWVLEGNHFMNKTLRVPAERLRGRRVRMYILPTGIERGRATLLASAATVHRVVESSGMVMGASAAAPNSLLPTEFALGQNFPNPFNPSTIVNYQLPVDNYVTIKVYDVLGREVKTLLDGYREAGYHQVELDASELASGVYLYRMSAWSADGSAPPFVETRKLVVMK